MLLALGYSTANLKSYILRQYSSVAYTIQQFYLY